MLKKYFLFLCLIGTQYLLQAQKQPVNAELQALTDKTLANYPRIREAELGNQIAAERTGIQRAGYLPTVTGNVSYNYTDPIAEATFGATKIRFQPHNNYNINLQANGMLFDFGRTKAAVNKAVAEYELGKANLAALREALAWQVAQLYYGIVFNQRNAAVLTEQIKSLQANKDLLASKQRNGDALELDVLNADVALANTQNRLYDLNAQLEKQQALLTALTGEESSRITAQNFDYQSVESDLSVAQNADLLAAVAKIRVAQRDSAYYRKLLRPSVSYNGGMGFRNGYQPAIDDLRFNWGLGASVSYPLYVGGKDRRQLRIAQLGIASAQAAAEGALRNATAEQAQARADQNAALQKLKTAETIVAQARAALAIAETRFKNGVATNMDVLTAQTNLEQAQLTALAAQYQLCIAGLQAEKIAGRLR